MAEMQFDARVPDAVREGLQLPVVSQVGFVVHDVFRSVGDHKRAHGTSPWLVTDQLHPALVRGVPGHANLRIALAYWGSVQLELIQPLQSGTVHADEGITSEERPHHLGFMVSDLKKRLSACERLGIGILQSGTIRDSGMTVEYVYLDTAKSMGIILELIRWRVGPVNLPMNRFVFRTACAIGRFTVFRGRVII